jgi:23S rRNA (cytosine1962-C5)-methyltransferase
LIAYQRLNQAALAVLADDGVLLSSSCSYHLEHQVFVRLLGQAAAHLSRGLQIVETGGQGPDHPIHPAIAETAYLNVLLARSLGSS